MGQLPALRSLHESKKVFGHVAAVGGLVVGAGAGGLGGAGVGGPCVSLKSHC